MARIFWVGMFPPESRSIGDYAQAYAVEKWLRNTFPDWDIFKFFRPSVMEFLSSSLIREGDYVFIHSSGDFGSFYGFVKEPEWGYWHYWRQRIIRSYGAYPIVQLPVTVYYDEESKGLAEDREFFEDKQTPPWLLVCARDEVSYSILRENFNFLSLLVPDFSFYSTPSFNTPQRVDEVLCSFRSDCETLMTDSERDSIYDVLRPLFDRVTSADVNYSISDLTEDGEDSVFRNLLEVYARNRLVLTDRMHGIIFSVATGTPCVALPGKIRHKTVGIRRFLPESVQYAESVEEVPDAIEKALGAETKPKALTHYFDDLKEAVLELGRE